MKIAITEKTNDGSIKLRDLLPGQLAKGKYSDALYLKLYDGQVVNFHHRGYTNPLPGLIPTHHLDATTVIPLPAGSIVSLTSE